MAAITPVGGAAAGTNAVITLLRTYVPTIGNTIVVGLSFGANISALTVQDNLGNVLLMGPTVSNGTMNVYIFYMLRVPTGVTGYTANWTGSSSVSILVEEYKNVLAINPSLVGNTATGTSASASLTASIEDANDFLVVMFGDGIQTFTASVGTQRQLSSAGNAHAILMDNTAGAPGAVTCTATLTSTAWLCVAIELQTVGGITLQPGFIPCDEALWPCVDADF